ncbi:MAG: ChbG/HpnK family deacetylase [Deltaproteobacteria bacterium]|nr:ChbG/HpnK family deacetylase [Deltaproteobacteria bacterium]
MTKSCWRVLWLLMSMPCVLSCARVQAAPKAAAAKVSRSPSIRLIVRGDDLGALHGIDAGAEKAFTQGIMTVAHVIVPGPWFPEAVRLLNAHPEVDVGIHLAITSEWSNVKWRPLTHAPSLVDDDGFFRPFIWPNKSLPGASHKEAGTWKLEEIEAELRAQIELIKKRLPRVSNGGCHMGCDSLDPKVRDLIVRLLREYKLTPDRTNLKHLPIEHPKDRAGNTLTWQEREAALIKALETVGPGDYEIGEHPATDDPEMRAISHPGYENVAEDRAAVMAVWTSAKVKEVIARRGIALIGFRDLPKQK